MNTPSNRFNPFEELRALERTVFGDNSVSKAFSGRIQAPTTDVYTREGAFVIETHLPGVAKEDIKVDVKDGRLSITAEHREREERQSDGDRNYLIRESSSSFSRTVNLPEGADITAITADLNEGVLTVTVPTPETLETKRTIQIN